MCSIPGVLLSKNGYSSAFFPVTIAEVEASLESGRLIPYHIPHFTFYTQYAGYNTMILLIAKVCALAPQQVQFMPIGGIIIPLFFFVIGKKLFGSNLIAALIALYVAFDPSISVKVYNTYAESWSIPLFASLVILYLRILKMEAKHWDLFLISLVFAAAFRMSWSIPAWMVVLSVSLSILLLIELFRRKKLAGQKSIFFITLLFVVIYLTGDYVFRQQYLPYIFTGKAALHIGAFNLQMILEKLGLIGVSESEPYLTAPSLSILSNWLNIIRYALILSPIVIYLFVKFKIIRYKKFTLEREAEPQSLDVLYLFIWASIILAGWHILASTAYGIIRFTIILFFFPFTAVACLCRTTFKKVVRLAVPLLLAVLAIANFAVFLNETTPQIKYVDTNPSSSWLAEHCRDQVKIIGGFATTSKFLANGIAEGVVYNINWVTSENYAHLVEAEYRLNRYIYFRNWCQYFVINKKFADRSLFGNQWKFFTPFSNYLDEINENINLSRVYNDGLVWILRPRRP
ncbi:MAG: hypothetical protein ACFFDT_12150 [Candidatus Hodarchaeota archaeon]